MVRYDQPRHRTLYIRQHAPSDLEQFLPPCASTLRPAASHRLASLTREAPSCLLQYRSPRSLHGARYTLPAPPLAASTREIRASFAWVMLNPMRESLRRTHVTAEDRQALRVVGRWPCRPSLVRIGNDSCDANFYLRPRGRQAHLTLIKRTRSRSGRTSRTRGFRSGFVYLATDKLRCRASYTSPISRIIQDPSSACRESRMGSQFDSRFPLVDSTLPIEDTPSPARTASSGGVGGQREASGGPPLARCLSLPSPRRLRWKARQPRRPWCLG